MNWLDQAHNKRSVQVDGNHMHILAKTLDLFIQKIVKLCVK